MKKNTYINDSSKQCDMEYFKLLLGVALTVGMSWIFFKNLKRKGFGNALLRIDNIGAIVVGVYLIVTSIKTFIV